MGEAEFDEAACEDGLRELVGGGGGGTHAESVFEDVGDAVLVGIRCFRSDAVGAAAAEVGLPPAGDGIDMDEEGLGR